MLEIDPESARKNMIMGWALFGVFVLLFAGTIAVAFIYLWIVD
jgi:nitrogen fixation protein FixH